MNTTPDSVKNRGWDFAWSKLDQDMKQLYTTGRLGSIHQLWARCYFEDLWTFMGPQAEQARYLELGAGRGTTSMYLAGKGCSVTMLDLSEEGFRVARTNFAESGLRIPEMVVGDAEDTGLPGESFDCVFSMGLLEHFEDPTQLLAETYRLLAPGGRQFALVVPDRPDASWLTNICFAPWRAPRTLAPNWLKQRLKRMLGHGVAGKQEPTLIRTGLGGADYRRILEKLGAEDIRSVPYNCFHQVYRSETLDSAVVLPLYRILLGIYRKLGKRPLLKTFASIASSEVVTYRKPRTAK